MGSDTQWEDTANRQAPGMYTWSLRSMEKMGGAERSAALKPMQGMSHRTPATPAAKLLKDQPTAFGVSHLLGPASRNHHFWGFCLLLHGQDIKDTSLHDTVSSAILPQSW